MDKFQGKTVGYKSAGLSLLSVLVATSIFVAVLLAVIRLMTSTTQATLISHDKFIGTNLAREGIELAQAVRDNNWMSSAPGRAPADWVKNGLCEGSLDTDRQMTLDTDNNLGTILVDSVTTDFRLYIDSSGQYHHNSFSGAVASPYSRVISVDCLNSKNVYSQADPLLRYVTITSTVYWERDSEHQEVSLMTRLYDWY